MRAARLPLLPALAAGLKLRGELDTLAPWAFVDRFCFVPTPEADADRTRRRRKSTVAGDKRGRRSRTARASVA